MADARARVEWNQTSAVLALLANIHRDPKKSRLAKPDDFNPYARRGVPAPKPRVGIEALKVFLPRPSVGA